MKAKLGFIVVEPYKVIGSQKACGEPVCLSFRALFGLSERQPPRPVLRIGLLMVLMHQQMAEFVGEDEARLRFAEVRQLPNLFINVQRQRTEGDVGKMIRVLVEDIEMQFTESTKCFSDKIIYQAGDVEAEAVRNARLSAGLQRDL